MARVIVEERACRSCGEDRYEAWQSDTGICIPCKSARTKQWRKDNRDRDRARRAEWEREARAKDPKRYWAQRCAISIKNKAKRLGLPYDLDKEFLYEQAVDVCPVLGIAIDYRNTVVAPNSPSVDQLKPGDGYVRGNVNIISNRANVIKQDATWKELESVASWIKRLTNEATIS